MAGGIPHRRSQNDATAADAQRERLVAAFAKAAAEHGYSGLELDHVAQYAGETRAAFEIHFSSKEQGLIAAQDAFIERIWLDLVGACEGPGGWPFKVRAGLASVLASLFEASSLARVFAVEAASASLAAAERQYAALDQFATLLREGRRYFPRRPRCPTPPSGQSSGASLRSSQRIC